VSVESQDLKLSGTCLHFTYVLKQQLKIKSGILVCL